MSFSLGIVGLPNVGKSTLFNALTKAQAKVSNYPFTTIDPNIGIVNVPDERLDKLGALAKAKKITPTTIKFVDVAGLIKGSHKGEGLGNQFLSHLRDVDGLIELVRFFEDNDVVHLGGKIDPSLDIETINLELCLADLEILSRKISSLQKEVKSGVKEAEKFLIFLQKIEENLNKGNPVRNLDLNNEEKKLLSQIPLLTIKPCLFAANVNEEKLSEKINLPHLELIIICAKLENELKDFSDEEGAAYLKELGLKESGLDTLIKKSYQLLNLITFFTIKGDETRAWTVSQGTKAPQAAGKVHSDMEKGFIKAEVIDCESLFKSGSFQRAHELGLVRLEGHDYEVKDGDVILFRFA